MAELERIYKDTDTGGWGWVTQAATGGEGGSTAGAARVLGPFPFAFDDAGLEDGIAFYTPTIGDVLLDAWIEINTAWDGTTPKVDIGTFADAGVNGLFSNEGYVDLTVEDSEDNSSNAGILSGGGLSLLTLRGNLSDNDPTYESSYRVVPAKFVAANPLKVLVTQTGEAGGGDPGATQGSGAVYLVVATPSLT